MRFDDYLSEGISQAEFDQFAKDTTQWFGEMTDGRLWRGSKRKVKGITKMVPRPDRTPRDAPLDVHNEFDKAFKKGFGWKTRSQGVFAATTPEVDTFGKPYLFYPVNGYKYVWSPGIGDLTLELNRDGMLLNDVTGKYITTDKWDENKDEYVKGVISKYSDKNLPQATWENVEVMFYCPNGYYLMGDVFLRSYVMDIEDLSRGK